MLKNSLWGVWDALVYDSFVWRNGLRSADRIATHMTGPEKRKLFELVYQHRPKVIVEIGSFLGASTSFLSQALIKYCPNGSLVAVDTWQNDAMDEAKRDTFAEFEKNTSRYRAVLKSVRATSLAAAAKFDQRIDLLFIDGDHEYEGVASDWKGWSPHLSQGAIVVMHDSGWAEGVQRVIADEISPRAQWEQSLPNLYWAKLSSHT